MGYTEIARGQQSTLGDRPLTPELARALAAYWAREVARMRELDLIANRQDADPLWPQELKRAQALAATLATQQVTEYTPKQKSDIFSAVKRFATEMDRWLKSSTMQSYPDFGPQPFKWPGLAPISTSGTDIQGRSGGGLLLLIAAILFFRDGGR